MVKTWGTHNTTETVQDNGWQLAVGGWQLVAVGGWWGWVAICGWKRLFTEASSQGHSSFLVRTRAAIWWHMGYAVCVCACVCARGRGGGSPPVLSPLVSPVSPILGYRSSLVLPRLGDCWFWLAGVAGAAHLPLSTGPRVPFAKISGAVPQCCGFGRLLGDRPMITESVCPQAPSPCLLFYLGGGGALYHIKWGGGGNAWYNVLIVFAG